MPTPTPEVEEMVDNIMHDAESFIADYSNKEWLRNRVLQALTSLTQKHKEDLEKAREEERKRIRVWAKSVKIILNPRDHNGKIQIGYSNALKDLIEFIDTPTKTDKTSNKRLHITRT